MSAVWTLDTGPATGTPWLSWLHHNTTSHQARGTLLFSQGEMRLIIIKINKMPIFTLLLMCPIRIKMHIYIYCLLEPKDASRATYLMRFHK